MATLYEYYNTGYDTAENFYGVHWRAQTFTPSIAHTITSVWLRLYRSGEPGTITVSIRATDGSGHPTGADLCSGTTNGNIVTTTTAGDWYEITLGAGYALSASVKYAIVVRVVTGNASNQLFWKIDASSPTYAGGAFEASADSGSSWTTSTSFDFMFEEWGIIPPPPNLITADAILQKTSSGSLAADAYLSPPIYTLTADAILQKTLADLVIANAILKKTAEDSLVADGVLQKTTSDTLDSDAVFFKTTSEILPADGVLFKTTEDSFDADAYLTYGVFANAVMFKTQENSLTVDAIIFPKQYIFTQVGPIFIPIYPIE